MGIKLSYEVGLIYITRIEEQYTQLYGFFDQLTNGEKGQDYFLYKEHLNPKLYPTEQVKTAWSNVIQQKLPNRYPFNSILKMVYKRGNLQISGTGSILLDKESGCYFIISCAHNFISIKKETILNNTISTYDDRSKDVGNYQFYQLSTTQVHNQPMRYKLTNLMVEIDTIQVHNKYIEYLQQEVQKSSNVKVRFSTSQNYRRIDVSQSKMYDIAIVKLKKKLEINHGFKINFEQQNFKDVIESKNIWVAGFPIEDNNVNTIKDRMYSESTQKHPNDSVLLSDNKSIIKHYLFTLVGNSGSPLYQKKGQDQCYLFGIHTSGMPYAVIYNDYQAEGKYNLGTYLYNKEIIQWLLGIKGLKESAFV